MAERSDLPAEISAAIDAAEDSGVSEGALGGRALERQREQAKRVEAMTLRLAGFTFEQIGARLHTNARAAAKMVNDTLETAENRNVEQMRELENARLDRVQAAIWTKALDGDLKAVDSFLKISTQRSRINGLWAPTKVEMNIGIRQEMEIALRDLEHLVTQEAQQVLVVNERGLNEE